MSRHGYLHSLRQRRNRWSFFYGGSRAAANRNVTQAARLPLQWRVPSEIVLSTRCDVLRDFDCQFQSRRRLRARNARLASGAGAFDERRELKLEWLLVFNADSVTPNLFSNAPIDFAALI